MAVGGIFDSCILKGIQLSRMVTLTIDRSHKAPVYEQVAGQIREFVTAGTLPPGTQLPSVRQLAGNLGVNLNTIARAYRLLQSEGFLTIRNRAGVSVAAPSEHIETSVREELLNQLRVAIARLQQAGMGTDEILERVEREVRAMNGGIQEKANE